jgi:flagellar basal-body rod modification protein FlgD
MTTTSATTATSTVQNTVANTANSDRQAIAKNFDQFLTLLTTQLKAQDPTAPLNTNDFTAQLVQFASVEQQIKSNDTLNSLLQTTQTSNAANALGFVGKTISASGVTTYLQNNSAKWSINAERGGTATITIKNEAGSIVATKTMTVNAGPQDYTWDGKTSDDTTAPAGKYTITITGKDNNNQSFNIATSISGVVDSVDLTTAPATLLIGTIGISMDKIKTISDGI